MKSTLSFTSKSSSKPTITFSPKMSSIQRIPLNTLAKRGKKTNKRKKK